MTEVNSSSIVPGAKAANEAQGPVIDASTPKGQNDLPQQPTAGLPTTDNSEQAPDAIDSTVLDSTASNAVKEPSSPVATNPVWPTLSVEHPLSKFLDLLPGILTSTSHNEVYGITLRSKSEETSPDFHTLLILQKFLRANQNDLFKAQEQLEKTLKWRKEFNPAKAAAEVFQKEKFSGLGYIMDRPQKDGCAPPAVTTWNIYGAVKDYEKTFVPVESFLRWRIGLMEHGVAKLDLPNATVSIPDYDQGIDPYQGVQIHDYKNVSFLRMDPRAKAASKATIELLSNYYPETLSQKFFVNIPTIMGWLYSGMKLLVNAETMKKFVVLSDGLHVAGELGEEVPSEYGGTLGALGVVGEEMKME